jgi:hypothetical protein
MLPAYLFLCEITSTGVGKLVVIKGLRSKPRSSTCIIRRVVCILHNSQLSFAIRSYPSQSAVILRNPQLSSSSLPTGTERSRFNMKSEDAVFLKTEQNVFIFIFKRTSLRLSEASQAWVTQWPMRQDELKTISFIYIRQLSVLNHIHQVETEWVKAIKWITCFHQNTISVQI